MNSPAPASPSMWTDSSWVVSAPVSASLRLWRPLLASFGWSAVSTSRELILGQDSALQVSWGLNPPEMIVSHAKK